MLRYAIAATVCCLIKASEESPRIVIVGAGPAGVAAGARLLENGFDNLTILEAENRIGGRLNATEFGGYSVDLGGQWVTGEDNGVYELVSPLGLLDKPSEKYILKVFGSSGLEMPEDAAQDLMTFYFNMSLRSDAPEEYRNGSLGDWLTPRLEEYFEVHPVIATDQRGPLTKMLCLAEMAEQAGDSWFNVSAKDHSGPNKGRPYLNWKDKTYSTVLDVLLKKIPNTAEELPFRNKTHLNAEVVRINYSDPDGAVRIITENGDEYTADHVIVTTSLGVLKANHEKMFNPPLPEIKVNAIRGLEYGSIAKIYLYYPHRWWPKQDDLQVFSFYWTNDDRALFANDPGKSWLLGIYSVVEVEHKTDLLCCWLSGVHAREMESVSEEKILSGAKELIHRFLGKTYNITELTAVLRTQWFTNKHFRGTYSYRSPETDRSGALAAHLAEPIVEHEKPRILFAGEATSSHEFATVSGAISSGWREADRLIGIYHSDKGAPETRR